MAGRDKPYLIGVDLGGTKILTVVADREGNILLRKKEETRSREGPGMVTAQIISSIKEVTALQGIKQEEILTVGICAAGFYNHIEKIIKESANLKNWTDVPLGRLVEKEINLSVYVENDANAAAYGEYKRGAGKGKSHMIYITVSTGIGGGIITDGKIFHGREGYAGEIGHVTIDINGPECKCGNRGCLETLASGTAIARKAAEVLAVGRPSKMLEIASREGCEEVSARHVFAAACLGDEAAAEIIEEAVEYLAAGLAGMANLFNPEVFIIGGGVSMSGNLFFEPLIKAFCRRVSGPLLGKVEIVPAKLGDEAGIVGIILLAAENAVL